MNTFKEEYDAERLKGNPEYGHTWYHLHSKKIELITSNVAKVKACISSGVFPDYVLNNRRARKVWRKLEYVDKEREDKTLERIYTRDE